MPHTPKILVVDDVADNRQLLADIFADNYEVSCVDSGESCLKQLEASDFDLVLLDVSMPEMDGYVVCEKIRHSPKNDKIPVIFVSALDSPEERLRGFEVGGDDYIVKPVQEDRLTNSVEKALSQHMQVKRLEAHGREAMQTAFQAMANSAELGLTIRYLQASYHCKSVADLASELLETLENYGLACSLLFRIGQREYFFHCEEDSMEAKVLSRVKKGHRILDYGARTIVNDLHVTLLIKNMPVDRQEDYGRIKDNMAVLIDGTEARCQALEVEQQLADHQKMGLVTLTQIANEQLDEIRTIIGRQKQTTDEVLSSISRRIEESVFRLGLDEREEQTIMTTIDDAIGDAIEIVKHSDLLEEKFESFVAELSKLSNH